MFSVGSRSNQKNISLYKNTDKDTQRRATGLGGLNWVVMRMVGAAVQLIEWRIESD